MNEDRLTGRIPLMIEAATTLGPLRPVRVSRWDRIRLMFFLWRHRP